MNDSTNLARLLRAASPVLDPERYVFVCMPGAYGDQAQWQPIASFAESEGLTLVVRREIADTHQVPYDGVFKRITLQVNSSLAAVGYTAAFSGALAAAVIAANVFAAFWHDHIFVPEADAARAMSVLATLADSQ